MCHARTSAIDIWLLDIGQQRAPTAGPSRRFSASSGARGPATGHSWLATVSALRRPYLVAQQPPAPQIPHAGFPRRCSSSSQRLSSASSTSSAASSTAAKLLAPSARGPSISFPGDQGPPLPAEPRFARCLCHMPALACASTPAPFGCLVVWAVCDSTAGLQLQRDRF